MSPLLALALFGALFGVGSSEVRRFERAAADGIRARLEGPHSRVKVKTKFNGLIAGPLGDLSEVEIAASRFATDGIPLFTEPDRPQTGRIVGLRLRLADFDLSGLHVRRLESVIPDCRYDYRAARDKKEIVLSRSGIGEGWVEITAADMEAWILRKYREIKRVRVSLDRDRAIVEGYGEFLIVKSDFRVTARLLPVDGLRLELTDALIEFGTETADEATKSVLLGILNPVVDLDEDLGLHGAIRVDRVTMGAGVLRASGKTTIPIRPPAAVGSRSAGSPGAPARSDPPPDRALPLAPLPAGSRSGCL